MKLMDRENLKALIEMHPSFYNIDKHEIPLDINYEYDRFIETLGDIRGDHWFKVDVRFIGTHDHIPDPNDLMMFLAENSGSDGLRVLKEDQDTGKKMNILSDDVLGKYNLMIMVTRIMGRDEEFFYELDPGSGFKFKRSPVKENSTYSCP